jgi:hypothetical protein
MNNYCLYWAIGSCGDIIQWIFSQNNVHTVISDAKINTEGKVDIVGSANLQDKLSLSDFDQFYLRSWSESDLEILSGLQPFLIGTHRLDQVDIISSITNTITVGITYTEQYFDIILRAWVKKVGQFDNNVYLAFAEQDKLLVDRFKSRNLYQDYLFKKFKESPPFYIPHCVTQKFDINIPFEIIAEGKIEELLNLLNFNLSAKDIEFFNTWYSMQSFKNHKL